MLGDRQFYKLLIYYQCISDKCIFSYILNIYYNILVQHDKLNYIYHNLLHLRADNYIWHLLYNLDIKLLSIKYDSSYDDEILQKFMCIIMMAVKKEINNVNFLVDKYLNHVMDKGNKFTKMHCSLLSFYISVNYDVDPNYDYLNGLVGCLRSSKKWFDEIHFFYNGMIMYSCHIYDIFIHTVKILHYYEDYQKTRDIMSLSKKKDMFMFKEFVALRYREDEVIRYIINSI